MYGLPEAWLPRNDNVIDDANLSFPSLIPLCEAVCRSVDGSEPLDQTTLALASHCLSMLNPVIYSQNHHVRSPFLRDSVCSSPRANTQRVEQISGGTRGLWEHLKCTDDGTTIVYVVSEREAF